MDLQEFIETYVMTDPEWREAHEAADATREGARAVVRAGRLGLALEHSVQPPL